MKPVRLSNFRLPTDVRPTRYDLHLAPDLEAGTFRGEVRIDVALARPRSAVTLHALDLTIERAVVDAEGRSLPAKATTNAADQTVTLTVREKLPPRAATLAISFRGKLGRQLRGLYAASADGRRYAFTQLEAADARRMMPCFDEPSFKARFRISVTASAAEQVLSNTPIESEEAAGPGKRTVRFRETPPLSTYLLALAVGALESSEERRLGPTPIRVWHVPGKGHLADFGLEAAIESLRRLEDYFGLPYPYEKLDLVAVPDFEAGAMENAGAVFFRETLLLVDPKTASAAEKKRAAEVIAHELAHMWYGDLVTMAWWDDLWLNEAFATWMAYRVVDDWRPDWRIWQGYEHDRAGALALDALASSHPIYAKVRNVAEATENFDAITYEKGCAVVRMIEHYLGPEKFRDGVRAYVRRHRESNATARDLWRALGEASGQDVERVAQAWIEQAGFPLLSLRRAGGRALAVRQERFFSDPRASDRRRPKTLWPVPMVVKRGVDGSRPDLERFLVERREARLSIGKPAAWIFGNASAGGFYRVDHDPKDHAKITRSLQTALSPVERMALVGDQWALVRSRRASIESFLDIADSLGDEPDYDVLDGLAGPLGLIQDQVVTPGSDEEAAFHAWIRRRFEPAFTRMGWEPRPGEDDAERLRRAALLRIVGLIGESETVSAEARRRLEAYLGDRSRLDSNLADPVTAIAARGGDDTLYEKYRELALRGQTPHERRRFLLNWGSFRAPTLVSRTLEATLQDAVPTQDVGFLVMRLFGNPAGKDEAWRFLTKRWAKLRHRVPPMMISRLVESTPSLREPRYAREVRDFFRKHPVAEAKRSLKVALEVFRLNAELRRRTAPGLAGWLAAR